MGAVQDIALAVFHYGLIPVLTICFVVFVHELGHYFAARCCGVRIPKFSVGFGKEIFGFYDRRGTRWSWSWIPLGGYVSIFGDVDRDNPQVWDKELNQARRMTDAELKVAFCSKSILQRSFIVVAGPFINLVLTFLIMMCVYMVIGQQYARPVITMIGIDSAADKAGFEIGDRIVAMDGRPIEDISKIYDQTFEKAGKVFAFDVLREGEAVKLVLTPEEISYTDMKGVDRKHGRTGLVNLQSLTFKDVHSIDGQDTKDNPEKAAKIIRSALDRKILITIEFQKGKEDAFEVIVPKEFNAHILNDVPDEADDRAYIYSPSERYYRKIGIVEAFTTSYTQICKGLNETYKIFSAVYQKKSNEKIVSGVSDIGKRVGDAAKDGIYMYLMIVALLSFMIALINIMPIPLFDGGYLLFFFIEAVRGKPVSQKIQTYAAILGLVLIGGIMVFANVSDFLQLFG